MIKIKRKEDCVGCNACVQVCPKNCINMLMDNQGFLYPNVDLKLCIECNICEKVCPVINQNEPRLPENVFAGWNNNETIRITSSSGGIFNALAKKTIEEEGVVFGARFNERWEVIHSYTENYEGIKAFRGSKYVQSKIGQSYVEAKGFLESGRKVLFSGTPCQIAGLNRFLRKRYEGLLLTVDVVCHGVPSPKIWKEYLDYTIRSKETSNTTKLKPSPIHIDELSSIENISFRDKRVGWEQFGFVISYSTSYNNNIQRIQPILNSKHQKSELFESFRKNLYMQGFLKDLYLRPACYECPAKCGKSYSDLTLADFWGIKRKYPQLYSKKGVSLILSNTTRGEYFLNKLPISLNPVKYTDALAGNPAIERSAPKPKIYNFFWKEFEKEGIPAIHKIILTIRPGFIIRTYKRLLHYIDLIIRILK